MTYINLGEGNTWGSNTTLGAGKWRRLKKLNSYISR